MIFLPGSVLSPLLMNLLNPHEGAMRYVYHSHLRGKGKKQLVNCPRLHCWSVVGLGFEARCNLSPASVCLSIPPCVLMRHTQRKDTERSRPCENTGRDWSFAAMNQEMPGTIRSWWPCPHLGFGLLASRTVRK